MADLDAIERELVVARMREDNHARIRLIPRALALPDVQAHRAEYLDELAYAYQQLGRFDDAIDAMRRAVAAGWVGEPDELPSAQALIADLLLRAGHTQEADVAWRQAEQQDPSDPRLHQVAGAAYSETGQHDDKALDWQTKGLALALAAGIDPDLIWMLTGERADTLGALGQPPDALQLCAEDRVDRDEQERSDALSRDQARRAIPPHRASVGLAWFPDGEYQRALATWPSFAEDYDHGPYADYCARLELLLRDLRAQSVPRLALTPIIVSEYLSWCAEHGEDPEQSDTRAGYASELLDDTTHRWPPERNQPCWCGSARKYKKCCLRAS